MRKDTLIIKSAFGFFSGFGIEIKITGDQFQSKYFMEAGGAELFKYRLPDPVFIDRLELSNNFQSLILEKQPVFEREKPITGYLSFTSPEWYEKPAGIMEKKYVKGRMYFTCLIYAPLRF